jgi:hypothetical protein
MNRFILRISSFLLMADRKAFLLRIDPEVLSAVQRWADDELRSLNGQIEFLLRKALSEAARARPRDSAQKAIDAHVKDAEK